MIPIDFLQEANGSTFDLAGKTKRVSFRFTFYSIEESRDVKTLRDASWTCLAPPLPSPPLPHPLPRFFASCPRIRPPPPAACFPVSSPCSHRCLQEFWFVYSAAGFQGDSQGRVTTFKQPPCNRRRYPNSPPPPLPPSAAPLAPLRGKTATTCRRIERHMTVSKVS